MNQFAQASASPNLALIKYWGKSSRGFYPATSSLGITLSHLQTTTKVTLGQKDFLLLNGQEGNVSPYLEKVRSLWEQDVYFKIESTNNFPTSAGLASSASGYAALAQALCRLRGLPYEPYQVSSLAREGSVSAARSVFGGFVALNREKSYAHPVASREDWSSLRLVVVVVSPEEKEISSRRAMQLCASSSPVWSLWLEKSELWFNEALQALSRKDLEKLGFLMGLSYRTMFATMLTSSPAILYPKESSLALIKSCQMWRDQGIGCWETMDAGPQVKILCEEKDLSVLRKRLGESFAHLSYYVDEIGTGTFERG
jgi:diphosphomevalonate decarboxylase